jgi:hypothetical protein
MMGLLCAAASLCLVAGVSVADPPPTAPQILARPHLFTPLPADVLKVEGIKEARSGCCSHHGGVAGCDSNTGHARCSDGRDSPTCGCE